MAKTENIADENVIKCHRKYVTEKNMDTTPAS